MLVSPRTSCSNHPGLYWRCQRTPESETLLQQNFATQSQHYSIFFLGFYMLHLKYWEQNQIWSNYSDSEREYFSTPTLRNKARYFGEYFIIHVDLCAEWKHWSEKWRTDSCTAAASTLYCKRRDHIYKVPVDLSGCKHEWCGLCCKRWSSFREVL